MSFEFFNIIDWLTQTRTLLIILWCGLGVLSFALIILMVTRWGQAKPMSKCVVLSLLAHLLLAGYAYTTRFFSEIPAMPFRDELRIAVVANEDTESLEYEASRERPAWERFQKILAPPAEGLARATVVDQLVPSDLQNESKMAMSQVVSDLVKPSDIERPLPALPDTSRPPQEIEAAVPLEQEALQSDQDQQEEPVLPAAEALERAVVVDQPSRVAEAGDQDSGQDPAMLDRLVELANTTKPSESLTGQDDQELGKNDSQPVAATAGLARAKPAIHRIQNAAEPAAIPAVDDRNAKGVTGKGRLANGKSLPQLYRWRQLENRDDLASQRGSSGRTEHAVKSALKWFDRHQSKDGRWDADLLGAGREAQVDGRNRNGSGAMADTGISGLALLAFLGAGHTHLEGPYRKNVQLGLEYLLRNQTSDGSLAGQARLYARMYCHGMALMAVGEAYAMTSDERMLPYLKRGIHYTVAAQHQTNGGWRYRVGDRGDMSQFGWQLMALKSAEQAGIAITPRTQTGMERFLSGAEAGEFGGLAAYRPQERPSVTMTAEALACRLLLGVNSHDAQLREATDYLLGEVPGSGTDNFYYWYYASLSLSQLGGEDWELWNQAMSERLLETQRTEGDAAGSWDPVTVWGAHGGRAYTTALGALCLEVYYRYATDN